MVEAGGVQMVAVQPIDSLACCFGNLAEVSLAFEIRRDDSITSNAASGISQG